MAFPRRPQQRPERGARPPAGRSGGRPLGRAARPRRRGAREVERREALEEVVRDIVALPAEQRAALALFELGDMSQTEIAEALACKPEKVKALVFQARTSLTSQREARSASCASVREKLATFHGGALNQRMIRLHLRHCRPCTAYRDELRDRRRKLALLLPVLPLPGMREAVLGAFGGGAGAAAHAPGLGAVRRAHWAAAGTAATVVVAGVALAGWPSGHDRREAAVRRPPPAAVPMSSAPVAAPRRAKRPARDPAPRRRRAHAAELAPRVAARAAHPRPVVERTAGPVAPEALRPRPSPALRRRRLRSRPPRRSRRSRRRRRRQRSRSSPRRRRRRRAAITATPPTRAWRTAKGTPSATTAAGPRQPAEPVFTDSAAATHHRRIQAQRTSRSAATQPGSSWDPAERSISASAAARGIAAR